MTSIWRIISNLVLVLAFIALSVFCLVEYQPRNVSINSVGDKLPLAKLTFTNLSYLVAYLEKMPSIRLVPVVTEGADYQRQVLDKIDAEQIQSLINNSNIKEDIPILKLDTTSSISEKINLKNLIKRVKEKLSENWFRS